MHPPSAGQLLLPFALQPYAENSYANRSLIAMFCVGGACLIAYVVFEWKWSPFPSAPKRLLRELRIIFAP